MIIRMRPSVTATELMARVLSESDIPLSDFTAAARVLIDAKFTAAEIRDNMESAIFLARAQRGNRGMTAFMKAITYRRTA